MNIASASPLEKQIVYVTGLPRSGSTLLCQLLHHHPKVHSPGFSSPLCSIMVELRKQLSQNEFFLAQLDADFDRAYGRLFNAFRGFINGWVTGVTEPYIVDKNRGWLNQVDLLHLLDPNCRLLVCVRELGQIYGSVEAQHQKTLLLDFPDHLAALSKSDRAKRLFADEGVIGAPLRALESVQDLEDALQERLYYVVFEHLISDPVEVMRGIYEWLGLPSTTFDPHKLQVNPRESDSYYRFKYPHQTYPAIQASTYRQVPKRFEIMLRQTFPWFYETFYPGQL
ncbi:MAG: sulfotransferase [Cyanobacteria bacterium J06559_3]